jgi:hypothetical protein
MTTWFISGLAVFDRHAKFYIEYKGRYSGNDYREYRIQVYRDGSWNVFANKGGWWKETNGVCEDAEPLLKDTLRKAQALLILKG